MENIVGHSEEKRKQPVITTQQGQQIKFDDLTPEQSLELVWQLLNRANKEGVYTIDESYTAKLLFDNLVAALKK